MEYREDNGEKPIQKNKESQEKQENYKGKTP